MGKTKKLKLSTARNQPLHQDIEESKLVKQSSRVKTKKSKFDEDEEFVDEKMSKKILDVARKQQQDLEDEYGTKSSKPKKVDLGSKNRDSDDDEDEYPAIDETAFEEIQVTEEDEKALKLFMLNDAPQRKTLADYISEKLKEKETEIATQFSDAGSIKMQDLDARVVELYRGVGLVLSRYRSGKIPKAFKIIPALANWEQILEITRPDSWSAAAMAAAARIFSSNLKEKMAQRFYNLILLPRVRDDIYEFKRLNFHLYQALRKALFKPGAFFKGIILPLCEGGDCTLREAVIIGSVLSKHHIPILHAGAAMLKIAEMDYSGANSIFLYILINKKYALPYRVIDGIAHHFLKFLSETRELPVLWHQCLLVFVQNYKQDLSSEQKDAIIDLLRHQSHHSITPVIRSEIVHAKPRDVEKEANELENEVTDITE